MKLPRPIRDLIESLEQLPGIGPKTATRLAFYLLQVPDDYLERFSTAVANLQEKTVTCSVCHNVSETDPCIICQDGQRDHQVLCVVEKVMDVLSLEQANQFSGVYHVLGGVINPLQSIGPEEIHIPSLLKRVKNKEDWREIVLATSSSMEGEATAMYLKKELDKINQARSHKFKITRMGQGLPVGADLEYADEVTLQKALEGRRSY